MVKVDARRAAIFYDNHELSIPHTGMHRGVRTSYNFTTWPQQF